jgi:hypothetical protein
VREKEWRGNDDGRSDTVLSPRCLNARIGNGPGWAQPMICCSLVASIALPLTLSLPVK